MAGGLMQLVSYGAQDIYISGNPQITFWKVLYKRHTNFAMENKRVVFSGVPSWGAKTSAVLPRNADLISKIYLYMELPPYGGQYRGTFTPNGGVAVPNAYSQGWGWNASSKLGYNLFDYVEIEIGGNVIDKQYSQWMEIWANLSSGYLGKILTANQMANGNYTYQPELATNSSSSGGGGRRDTTVGITYQNNIDSTPYTGTSVYNSSAIYIPLSFWFTDNPGLALPLISLQYHEVKLNILMSPTKIVTSDPANLINTSAPPASITTTTGTPGVFTNLTLYSGTQTPNGIVPNLLDCALYVDYVYLDTEERRRFAQQSHEYLIEQCQVNDNIILSSPENVVDLILNHPVKELVWVLQPTAYTDCGETVVPPTNIRVNSRSNINYGPVDFSKVNHMLLPNSFVDILEYAQLKLNGQDRFEIRRGDYFSIVQSYQNHTGVGANLAKLISGGGGESGGDDGLAYTYSFALHPEEHQPSGTCNFSRIDKATFNITLQKAMLLLTGPVKFKLYARNYNVLRVMSGMAGLAFSN